jgi:flagellar basal-body rod protein FlgB
MDALSAILNLKALDGLMARQAATAENIANAGTAGYRPARVDFESALKMAAAEGPDAVKALEFQVVREQPAPGDGLRLDLELATASGSAARYAALIEVLNRQLQIQALAAQGGR